jgi:hypothetical protein
MEDETRDSTSSATSDATTSNLRRFSSAAPLLTSASFDSRNNVVLERHLKARSHETGL